jgi:hypothetical protein
MLIENESASREMKCLLNEGGEMNAVNKAGNSIPSGNRPKKRKKYVVLTPYGEISTALSEYWQGYAPSLAATFEQDVNGKAVITWKSEWHKRRAAPWLQDALQYVLNLHNVDHHYLLGEKGYHVCYYTDGVYTNLIPYAPTPSECTM